MQKAPFQFLDFLFEIFGERRFLMIMIFLPFVNDVVVQGFQLGGGVAPPLYDQA